LGWYTPAVKVYVTLPRVNDRPRRSRAGGARKRPVRYTEALPGPELRAALHAHRKGALVTATEAYRAALVRDPDSLDAWTNLGAVLSLRGRAREAHAVYLEALVRGHHDPRALRDAGIGLAVLGYYADARNALGQCLLLDPAQVGARLALSRACGEDGDRPEALHHAEAAVQLAPEDVSAWLELHRARFDDARPAACAEAAARAVECAPEDVLARVCLAGALYRAGDAAGARAVLGDSAVPEGLRTMVAAATEGHAPETRAFAYKRDALVHALSEAPGEGTVLEFGVRHGVSTRVLAAGGRTVHGFDSFAGLPEAWQGMPAGAFSTEGEAPALPPNVVLHVGRFDDTLPGFVAAMTAAPALVHVDSDLYSSARAVLTALGPRVRPGCVLLFDEYFGNARWQEDEHRAMTEAAAAFGWRTAALSCSWVTGQAALRVLSAGDGPRG
jgi:tetratricopeptide (TPR) repeat protein